MRLTLNYVCTVISACTHLCNTNTFTHISQKLQLKINNIWMEFFWNQKIFHLGIKEISILKSCINYYNKLVLINKLMKLSADISDSSFLLDSLSKAKIYLNFATGSGFLFFKRFWKGFLADVILLQQFSCSKKSQCSYFNFFVLPHKNKCFC